MTATTGAPAQQGSSLYPSGIPRLNHVAMSVSADTLRGTTAREIVEFHRDCFGWGELDQQTEEGRRLVLAVGHWDQFVFLHAEEEPMTAPRLDHYGVAVHSKEDFDATWERVAAKAEADSRVDAIAPSVDDFEVVRIHSLYVRFLLPMMVEVQYWEFA